MTWCNGFKVSARQLDLALSGPEISNRIDIVSDSFGV